MASKKTGSKTGRPSLYKDEYIKQAFKLCLLGATHADLARFFEVSIDTISEWRNKHPEFSASLKNGKDEADANVAHRLYRRALGYSHKEDKIFQYEGRAIIVPTTKRYPPDPTSAIFWLKNRQPDKWRDKPQGNEEESKAQPAKVDLKEIDGRKPDAKS